MVDWIKAKNSLVKLSCTYVLGPILKRYRKGTASERVLFIESAGLGDMCVLLPFVRGLPDQNYKVDVCCPEGVADLWRQLLPADCRIITFNYRTLWSVRGVNKLRSDFGSVQYDAVFSVTQSSTSACNAVCARAKLRVGMVQGKQFYKGGRIVFDQLYRAQIKEHMYIRIEKQFALFHQVSSGLRKFVAPSAPSETGQFLLIHPGSKWIPKRWPAENVIVLAAILRQRGIPVTVAAHTSEPDLISCFSEFNDGNDQCFVITPDIKSLMDLISRCTVYVGNDSGPTHLANLYAKPMIVIWGPALLERIYPIGEDVTILKKEVPCRPCPQREGAKRCSNGENICLTRISVDEVYEKVLMLCRSYSSGNLFTF